jgi:hypothetical protein
MAKTEKVGVRLSGRFSPGQEVVLFERHGTHFDFAHVGSAIAEGKVDRTGVVEFDGLVLGRAYWVAGEDGDGVWRAAQMTAKTRPVEKARQSDSEIAEKLAQTRPPASAVRASTSVTGARSTSTARVVGGNGQPFVHPQIGKPTPKGERDTMPAPYARIEDTPDGTPLRSHTVTGEAHPVNPALPDGKLRQDQVPEDVPQASCTPHGEATIIGDEDQALARLEQKVPPSQAEDPEVPARTSDDDAEEIRRTQTPEPKTAGIEAAQTGKVPAESKRAAQGKTPTTTRKRPARKRSAAKPPAKAKASASKATTPAKRRAPGKASPKKS